MNLQIWARKVVCACVLLAIVTTTSMVAPAAPGRVAAELTVSGKVRDGEAPTVLVNGEASKSGRSIFSSSNISTPDDTTATLSVGKTGRVELGPNSSVDFYFDDDAINAELKSGKLTVQGAQGTVKVRTNDGKTTNLQAGESITASGEPSRARQTGGGSEYWLIWVLVAAGAAAAVAVAVASGGDGNDSPSVPVSPNR